jgi:hypothetical protein
MSTPASVRVRCPHCQKAVSIPAALRGETVTCPNTACGKSIPLRGSATPTESVVPALSPQAALAPAPGREAGDKASAKRSSLPLLLIGGVGGVGCLFLVGVVVAGAVAFLVLSKPHAKTQSATATTEAVAPIAAPPGEFAHPNPKPAAPDNLHSAIGSSPFPDNYLDAGSNADCEPVNTFLAL